MNRSRASSLVLLIVLSALLLAALPAAAQDAKETCPVSKALTGVPITLEATLA